jgi:hypothetical protein
MPLGPDGDWFVSGVHGEAALLVELARFTAARDWDRAGACAGACWGISKGCGIGLTRSWAATNWGQEITMSTRTANDTKTLVICDFMSALLLKLGLRDPRCRGIRRWEFRASSKNSNGTAGVRLCRKTDSELLLGPREWQERYVRTLPESTARVECVSNT